MKQISRSDSRGEKIAHQNSSKNNFQTQASSRDLFSSYKSDKKLKPDKIYRFVCGGLIDHGTDKVCKKVEYKAEYDRPVEEFIYPSLQTEIKTESSVTKSKGRGEKSYDSHNLRWKFKEEDIKPTEISSRNSLVAKLEKGEKYLQESLKTKYHGRILAELKEKEDKLTQQAKTSSNLAQLADSVQHTRRENIVKSLGIFERKASEKEMNSDDLVRRLSRSCFLPSHLLSSCQYYSMLTGHKLVVQRHVERYVAMKPIERAHADLSRRLIEIEDGTKTNLHDGILYYQVYISLSYIPPLL
jgi:hypothetical protein